MVDRFTATPDPVSVGQDLEVCYDFNGANGPVGVTVDYHPDSVQDSSHTLDESDNCFTVKVPQGATSILLVDSTSQSEDHAVSINP